MEKSPAEKVYASMLKAQAKYHEKKRQAKKDAGTYRSVGRPKKNADKLLSAEKPVASV